MATIALSAGHNRSTGARAHDGTDEWSWCLLSVYACRDELENLGHTVHIFERNKSLRYTSAMRQLARQIKSVRADCCLEFHFNSSSNILANGYEFLHWWGSKASKKLAQCVADSFGLRFNSIKPRGNRGVRSLWFHKWNKDKGYSGRGGAYCYLTPCPAIICEPGFGSNRDDWFSLSNNAKEVGKAYARGINRFLK